MGLGDLINAVGDGFEHMVTGAEHVVGTVVDDGSHLLGDGLNAVGLHGAATAVDNFGDNVADHLGDQVAEKQLGETTDPTQLVHGDRGAIIQTATRLAQFAAAFDETARGLNGIDTSHWQGSAADAFRRQYQQHPRQWTAAHVACASATSAWRGFATAVGDAQNEAHTAITLYQHGIQASAQAKTCYDQAVATYIQQAHGYDDTVNAGGDPGPMPRPPTAFLYQARPTSNARGRCSTSPGNAATPPVPTLPRPSPRPSRPRQPPRASANGCSMTWATPQRSPRWRPSTSRVAW